jgi:aspartyl-tRNA(Asn)/glutamyl-tRNA(Gln) amidotransferase subunit B
MATYTPTIGLEIHAELATATKMFCRCVNNTDETRPNVNVCPICMGHPGTLPVPNKEAIKHVLKVGVAVGGTLADFSEFDRKNYFYPDIPKGYQISQYKFPLVTGGAINGIQITRIHLEEDTAKSSHDTHPNHAGKSLVDFNRSGVPLMELVTEPVIHSAEDASAFARELQLLLQYLGVAHANMEKANISVSDDPNKFGTKVEVKNLNSFRSVEKAIAYEIKRHISALENGEKIVQETRGWDEVKESTFSQRTKEDSHDYRYFPEPDIPKLKLSEVPEFGAEALTMTLPELPWQKRDRYTQLGLKAEDAEFFVRNREWATLVDAVIERLGTDTKKILLATNYLTTDLAGLVKKGTAGNFSNVTAEHIVELVEMISANELSSRGAKDVLAHVYATGGSPKAIATQQGLLQKSDPAELKAMVEKIVADNQSVVEQYKAGKESSLQFLIGQGMKLSKGSANPEMLKTLFLEVLK